MLISQLCFIIIFCFHLLSQSAADAGCLVCVIQQFALTGSDKGAISFSGGKKKVKGLEKSNCDNRNPAAESKEVTKHILTSAPMSKGCSHLAELRPMPYMFAQILILSLH